MPMIRFLVVTHLSTAPRRRPRRGSAVTAARNGECDRVEVITHKVRPE